MSAFGIVVALVLAIFVAGALVCWIYVRAVVRPMLVEAYRQGRADAAPELAALQALVDRYLDARAAFHMTFAKAEEQALYAARDALREARRGTQPIPPVSGIVRRHVAEERPAC
ncbi:hypothetical protein [Sorangium sp. So ce233]|uniref:hypothetical protein n=1 Tax=Sorangium sp. So ce233 TaxID=3133290 RepID=UPI003F5FBE50